MKALKCDNCGGYYDYNVIATTKVAFCRDCGAIVSEKDLCPECLAAVTTTLEDRKKIKIHKKTDPFDDAASAFKELDKKVHSEIYILKKCLAENDGAVDACLTRSEVLQERISDLEKERTCCESLAETIEFQSKKIEELEAEKARLKEAYDIHEETIERLNLLLTQQDEIDALKKENSEFRTHNEDLSYGHKFEFGDKVFVPWSDIPYMYIKTSLMYNPRTERLVYVGKSQHLKWTGEKFEIK